MEKIINVVRPVAQGTPESSVSLYVLILAERLEQDAEEIRDGEN